MERVDCRLVAQFPELETHDRYARLPRFPVIGHGWFLAATPFHGAGESSQS